MGLVAPEGKIVREWHDFIGPTEIGLTVRRAPANRSIGERNWKFTNPTEFTRQRRKQTLSCVAGLMLCCCLGR
jgi:hypothetical protein